MEFKTLTISFADNILDQLQKYCERTGQKQTDVVRQAVYEFLNNFYMYSTPYGTTFTGESFYVDDEKE